MMLNRVIVKTSIHWVPISMEKSAWISSCSSVLHSEFWLSAPRLSKDRPKEVPTAAGPREFPLPLFRRLVLSLSSFPSPDYYYNYFIVPIAHQLFFPGRYYSDIVWLWWTERYSEWEKRNEEDSTRAGPLDNWVTFLRQPTHSTVCERRYLFRTVTPPTPLP